MLSLCNARSGFANLAQGGWRPAPLRCDIGGMEKVSGIGGVFFRAADPVALGRWYRDHLGVALVPSSDGDAPWQQDAGPTVFAPFHKRLRISAMSTSSG